MAFSVQTTRLGRQDLADIVRYVIENDSPAKAEVVLTQLESAIGKLAEVPSRGRVPPELESTGESEIREIRVKPWRIIYEVRGRIVWVLAILDGRRNLAPILQARLLRAKP